MPSEFQSLKASSAFLNLLLDNFGPNGEREGRQLFHSALQELSALPLDRLLAGIFERANNLRGRKPPGDDMSLFAVAYCD